MKENEDEKEPITGDRYYAAKSIECISLSLTRLAESFAVIGRHIDQADNQSRLRALHDVSIECKASLAALKDIDIILERLKVAFK